MTTLADPTRPPAAPPPSASYWRTPKFALRAIVFIFFLWLTRSLLVPVALGGVFAILLFPWNTRLKRRLGRAESYSPLLLTIGSFVGVVVPLAIVSVEAFTWMTQIVARVGTAPETVERNATNRLLPLAHHLHLRSSDLHEVVNQLVDKVSSWATALVGAVATSIPTYIIDVFLFGIALYYFLRDGMAVVRWIWRILPFGDVETDELYISVRETIHGAVMGSIATAIVQGAMVVIAFLALQVPGAFFYGIVAAILSFMPVLGTAPVTLGATAYLLLNGRWISAAIMFGAAVVIGISDNVVRPWVTSAKGNLHPLLALVSIFGGLQAFGPFGIFLGPVVGAMAIWTLDTYGNLRRAQADVE